MTPEDSLLAISEIGIGLAGFSGLVAAFVQHSGQEWRLEQKARIVLLIILSFGLMISSLIPFALSGINDSPALVWGTPMVAFSLLCLSLLVVWIRTSRKYGFRLYFPFISLPIMSVASTLQVIGILSGIGLIFPYSPTLFVFCLLSVLIFGANIFLALLYSIWG
ncbi:MAG: hypothetical protein R3F41_20490 [Gammaproteobacteria bacterium]|nr:hypothetical protein [Pseudomonadales bacterium]MCP5346527.1 hypothetical protein [Pseudomonadales bacterium]